MEILLLFLLALLLLGPEEIPPLARFINQILNELKTIFQKLEKEWSLTQTNLTLKTDPTNKTKSTHNEEKKSQQ